MKQLYDKNIVESKAKELAAYIIMQCSRMDPDVGGPIKIAVIDDNGLKEISTSNFKKIKQRISKMGLEMQYELTNLVGSILEKRQLINKTYRENFNFELFKQDEQPIFDILRPSLTEEDFINKMLALGILIDQINIPAKDEKALKEQGSIDALEGWLKETFSNYPSEIVENFRDIQELCNEKVSVHLDNPRFIKTILTWDHQIPPDWSKLFFDAIRKYDKTLEILSDLLKT